ncbi:MAG: ribokinase [Anaerolineales bacterium]|nr:ribokinase [Chloroflexota bacterium]MBL6980991.1 ribokinase [Anaerolineales bacterium]
MQTPAPYGPIDYLVVGHLSEDCTPEGIRLGGTAAYSALTARSLGMRVGIVTAWDKDLPLHSLQSIPIAGETVEQSTIFENTQTDNGRQQWLHHVAPSLDYYHIPETWRTAGIVHLGPIAQEVEPSLVRHFPDAFIGATAQGWLREWDIDGKVFNAEWPEAPFVLNQLDATVISIEDVSSDESRIEEMADVGQVFAVTEGAEGARVYWQDEVRHFPATHATEIDSTGAGDIFATAFFIQLQRTANPWKAAEFANEIAAISVTRTGLESIPGPDEIYSIYSAQVKV